MSIDDNTPVLVGVGQITEPVAEDLSAASSPVVLASKAAAAALDDAGMPASELDVIAVVRTMADSTPPMPSPFGTSNQPPRSVANAIGASPQQLVHSKSGGNTPQQLVNEWAAKLYAGQASAVLLTGAEALATTKAALRAQQSLDWSEKLEGPMHDCGIGLRGMIGVRELQHGLVMPTTQYAIAENARRAQLGRSYSEHAKACGELLAPFSAVASSNEYSMFREQYTAAQIATPGDKNTYVDLPYTYRMIAKDSVNQGAAVVLTTVAKARQLGIDEQRWVYLHAYAQAEDLPMLERENLASSLALTLTYQQVLKASGLSAADIAVYDIYSCFPIVIDLAKQALGISDPKIQLTQTGGLPFFGGAGNNYTMHAIAEVVTQLRAKPTAYGLVGANGGMINKHAVGIYSCRPGWQLCDSSDIQQQVNAQAPAHFDNDPHGAASIETYTVTYWQGTPFHGIVIGRLQHSGARFIANNFEGDAATLQKLVDEDCIGQTIFVASRGKNNVFAFEREQLRAQLPEPVTQLRKSY
ncbi:MAG: acetyl-CoA acetyltransferase, partial [Gammaproteobacteria bacterium]|nr:acetyl-CoA acetyltransferase [Gammaproteobacteria bacterium]